MTTTSRSLRVAVVSGNTIVEERLLRGRAEVTIGPSVNDTFVVAASPELPRSFTLFSPSPSGWTLHFTRRMAGRVALDEKMAPLPLDELGRSASRQGELFHAPLGDRGRGRIEIGDLTILYQLVAPAPLLPRPQLPPSLRGSFFRNLDGLMIALVGLSFVAHTALVAYLRTIDLPRTPDIERLPDRVVKEFLLPRPVEPKPDTPRVDPNAHRAVATNVRTHHHAQPVAAEGTGTRRAQLVAQIEHQGLLNIITSRGEHGLLGGLIPTDPGSDADDVFRNVSGVRTAGGAPSLHSLRNGGGPVTRPIDRLRGIDLADVQVGDAEEHHAPKGEWLPREPIDVGDPTLVPVITGEINRRKRAISACYERAIHGNPALAGKLQLHFRLSAIGKVTGADIESDTVGDEGMRRCITTTVSNWRFPPMRTEAEFSYPFIFQPIH